MSQSNKSFLDRVRDFFTSLFGSSPVPPSPPALPPAPVITDEPLVPLAPRVLVIVYDPLVDKLKNLRLVEWGVKNRGWKRVDDLIAGYIADVDECSGGLVKYNIVQRIDVDEFPLKLNGKRFDALEYLDLYTVNQSKYKEPDDRFDYTDFIKQFDLSARVNGGEIDEVWTFTYPFSGVWEAAMCGTNAFDCNGPVIGDTKGRRYVIMGFSYERGIGEMEENLGHRAERVIARVYGARDFLDWTYGFRNNPTKYDALKFAEINLFGKFLLHDKIAPGNAQCGNVHYAPNSDQDYDWGNPRPVITYADDWLTFPNLPRVAKMQNASSWGNGDIRGHHRWWFQRFPKLAGRMNGVRMNWWSYICDVTNPEFDQRGGGAGAHVG